MPQHNNNLIPSIIQTRSNPGPLSAPSPPYTRLSRHTEKRLTTLCEFLPFLLRYSIRHHQHGESIALKSYRISRYIQRPHRNDMSKHETAKPLAAFGRSLYGERPTKNSCKLQAGSHRKDLVNH